MIDHLERARNLGFTVKIIGVRYFIQEGAGTWYLNTIQEFIAFMDGASHKKRKGEDQLKDYIKELEKKIEVK